jgi:hypothetical protein
MNADNFEDAPLIYDFEFNNIISFICDCYHQMLKKYDGEFIENNENKLRNRLYKDFLNSNEVKSQAELFPCRFECECAEIDDSYQEIGYSDIKVLTSTSLMNTDAHYIIECKRLDGSKHLNSEYIKEGIARFINPKKYPTYYNLCGMIGFIVKQIDIDDNVNKINELLKKSRIKTSKSISHDRHLIYSSVHQKDNKLPLKIQHLMFDFSILVKR